MRILRIGKILPIVLRIPPVRCEYSNILMVPTSAPGLHVRGMGIATSLAGHRRTVISPGRYKKDGTR
jgi:hypothetical protein